MEIHMVENRQKGITNAYRNDKKDVDTRASLIYPPRYAGLTAPHHPPPPHQGLEDTVTVRPYIVFFPPKTPPPRHFHHQKVLCDANIYICIALKIINTPVNRSSSLT
jgi:hypothetical protein